jgi:hypothetical protein
MSAAEYPEHEKLAEVSERSQAIGEFLDLALPSMGIHLCEADEETGRYWPTHRPIQSMLAEWFEIDQKKLDAEKEAMLEAMREANR